MGRQNFIHHPGASGASDILSSQVPVVGMCFDILSSLEWDRPEQKRALNYALH